MWRQTTLNLNAFPSIWPHNHNPSSLVNFAPTKVRLVSALDIRICNMHVCRNVCVSVCSRVCVYDFVRIYCDKHQKTIGCPIDILYSVFFSSPLFHSKWFIAICAVCRAKMSKFTGKKIIIKVNCSIRENKTNNNNNNVVVVVVDDGMAMTTTTKEKQNQQKSRMKWQRREEEKKQQQTYTNIYEINNSNSISPHNIIECLNIENVSYAINTSCVICVWRRCCSCCISLVRCWAGAVCVCLFDVELVFFTTKKILLLPIAIIIYEFHFSLSLPLPPPLSLSLFSSNIFFVSSSSSSSITLPSL